MFSKNNIFRKILYRTVKHEYFESVILGAIIASSIKLVSDTYIDPEDPNLSTANAVLDNIDMFFIIFFAIEAFIKIISFGLIFDDNSYLREGWS